jgi:Zn-dependent membrane protease YugP
VRQLIMVVSLVPIVISIAARKFFCDRGVRSAGDGETSRTGRELAERLLGKAGLADKVEIVEKRKAGVKVGPVKLMLTKHLLEAKNVIALGEVALLCGHALVAVRNPDLLKWRQWAVKFSWAFPVFTLVVLVFAVVVAKTPVGWGIAVAVAALGVGSGLSLASLPVELQAAKLMAMLIDESHAFPRLREGEQVALACQALAYRRAVPGALEWLMGSDMEKKLAKEVGKRVARKVVGR